MCATAEEGYAFSGGEGEVAVKVEEGGCAGGEGRGRRPLHNSATTRRGTRRARASCHVSHEQSLA